jgi:hypothetical protein
MLFFLLIHAEAEEANDSKANIKVTDNKLDELKKKQNEVKKEITGEKDETAIARIKNQVHSTKKSESNQYNGSKICISEGGCPPSNDTTASDIREIHKQINEPNKPLIIGREQASRDIFQPREKNLRDPWLPAQS